MDIISKHMKAKDTKSRIYAEIRQAAPFDRSERELAVVLLRTGDVLPHSIGRALAPWDLSNEQYNALRILRGAGDRGHPTLEVSRRLISRSPNITRLLDKLIEKGLARRDRDAEDRRQAVIRITAEGRGLLDRCDAAVDAVLAKLRALTASEIKEAVGFLDRLREAVAVTTVREGLESQDPEERRP
jgi:DNA-binding MarR family transcriptional regulator